jgi:predicted nucleic acid-binding protein
MACLDTDALVDLTGRSGRRLRTAVRAKIAELLIGGAALVTTRFNVAELWVGVTRSADPRLEEERVAALLHPLRVLEFGEREAQVFGRLAGHLQERGTPIGDIDALIASVCLAHGHAIVTRNVKHFAKVPGLAVVTY